MPKNLSHLCNASRAHIAKKQSSPHVWISDELLSDTFASFTKAHRRHGSNVPGPLEAQRRAKGRRATTATHAPAKHAANIAALNTVKPQRGWWKATGDSERSTGLLNWSLGLLNSRVPHQPEELPNSTNSHEKDLYDFQDKLSPGQQLLFESQLEKVNSHSELIKLLDELKIDFIHNHDASQIPLKIILKNGWGTGELENFLLDPRTNPPGACNHLRILQPRMARPWILRVLVEDKVFSRALRLGLIQAAELKEVLINACSLDPACLPKDHDPAFFCNELLTAIKTSDVLKENNLDTTARDAISTYIARQPFHHSTPRLLYNLGTRAHAIVEICLRMVTKDTLHLMHSLIDFWKGRANAKIMYRLAIGITRRFCDEENDVNRAETDLDIVGHRGEAQRAEHRFRRGLVGRSTQGTVPEIIMRTGLNDHKRALGEKEYLERLPRSDDLDIELNREPNKVEVMHAFLALFGQQRGLVEQVLLGFIKESVLVHEHKFEHFDVREHLLVCLWVVMSLTVHAPAPSTSAPNESPLEELYQRMHELLIKTFINDNPEREQDLTASILHTLERMPLPAKNKLWRRIHAFTSKAIEPRRGYHYLIEKLDRVEKMDLDLLIDDDSYFTVTHHFPLGLQRIAESMNDDLAIFEKHALTLMKDYKGRASFILKRLIPHNKALLAALRGDHNLPRSASKQQKKFGNEKVLGGYTYSQLMGLCENFAWACANTQQMSDRNAYRHTHWFVQFLVEQDVPITRKMLKALWHAGVTRNKYHSYGTVALVHGVVRRHGGLDLANQLVEESSRSDPSAWHTSECVDVLQAKARDKRVAMSSEDDQQIETTSSEYRPFADDVLQAKSNDNCVTSSSGDDHPLDIYPQGYRPFGLGTHESSTFEPDDVLETKGCNNCVTAQSEIDRYIDVACSMYRPFGVDHVRDQHPEP